jgi:predicted nucleotidyltransferase component of viral defense system
VIFFGGTALSRSLIPDGRLSEDIDLIATGRRRDVGGLVERALVRGARREYWDLISQTRLRVSAAEAITVVRDAWRCATSA